MTCRSLTPVPVIGVPVRASALDGLDSLLPIVQVYYFLLNYYIYGMGKCCKDPVSCEYNISSKRLGHLNLMSEILESYGCPFSGFYSCLSLIN